MQLTGLLSERVKNTSGSSEKLSKIGIDKLITPLEPAAKLSVSLKKVKWVSFAVEGVITSTEICASSETGSEIINST